MKSFNVLNWDINSKEVEHYDIMPYFVRRYESTSKLDRPRTFEEFKKFVERWGKYQFWARCEYEFIMVQWPYRKDNPLEHSEKIDIWDQIEMNLDIVTTVLMENVK